MNATDETTTAPRDSTTVSETTKDSRQTTDFPDQTTNYSTFVATEEVSNPPGDPIRFAELSDKEQAFLSIAIEQGYACGDAGPEAFDLFVERLYEQPADEEYLRRNETDYGLFVLELDEVYAATADPPADADTC